MLTISGFENEIITEFSLTKKVYFHSNCRFCVNICSKAPEDFLKKLGSDIAISFLGRYIFRGYITAISANNYFSYTEIIVQAASHSLQYDQKPEKRIFQNPRKTFGSIIAFLGKTGNLDITIDDQTSIEHPVIQDNETDFSFIIRMAQTYRKYVFVHDDENSDKVRLTIGTTLDSPPARIGSWEKFSCTEAYDTNSEFPNQTHRIIELILRNQYLCLGQQVMIENQTKYVAEAEIYRENNIFKFKYKLYDLDKMPYFETSKLPEQVILMGVTTDNNDSEFRGRIKVSFDCIDPNSNKPICGYSDIEPEERIWIPYHTPYSAENGGFIFLPDIGDFVEVIYRQENFTAYGVHGLLPLKEGLQTPENKYIANIFGKQIIFKKEQLEIQSNENTIVLSDEDISLKAKNNKLTLNDSMLVMEIGKTKIIINDNIQINTQNIQTQANSDITQSSKTFEQKTTNGSIVVNAQYGTVEIRGKRIHLK